MASPRDPEAETVRKNLAHYRALTGLTQEDASQLSGVSVDMIRRYESGKSGASASALRSLAKIYGCKMEDFYAPKDPPPPDLANRPVIYFRTLPGVTLDPEVMSRVEKLLEEANAMARTKRKPPRK